MIRCIRALLLTMTLLAITAAAPSPDVPQSIEKFMSVLIRQQKFSGVLLVADNGEIIYERASGMADYGRHRPIQKDTLFNLASVSKQFTAMGIMMLKEKGLLAYDDDIRKYLPGLPYRGVTIRHLLHHTSGLPDYIQLADDHWDERKLLTNKDALDLLKRFKPAPLSKPGTEFDYSNTGYMLLASIIERVSGTSYADFLNSRIFKPLGMTGTVVYSPANLKPFGARRAFGYRITGAGYELNDVTFEDGVVGDGGIYSTAEDLLRWDQALNGEALVAAKTLIEAFTPGKLNNGDATEYGFGWYVQGNMVWHDGSWVGFRSLISRYLDTSRTVIILTNNNCEVMGEIDKKIEDLLGE